MRVCKLSYNVRWTKAFIIIVIIIIMCLLLSKQIHYRKTIIAFLKQAAVSKEYNISASDITVENVTFQAGIPRIVSTNKRIYRIV